MEFLFAIIVLFISLAVKGAEKAGKAARDADRKEAAEFAARQQTGRTNPGSAFEQARQRATQNQRATGSSAFAQAKRQGTKEVFSNAPDPGRVSAQSVAQSSKQAAARRKAAAQKAMQGDILMRPVVTRREKFERSSAYERSNLMDVQYTSNGCGCTTGKGNASSGKAHGFSSATYDEARFFKESREICSGKWS